MKHTALVERTFNIDILEIRVPISQEDIDDGCISSNIPHLENGVWNIWIDIDEGKVRNWPSGFGTQKVYLKVVDTGTYILYEVKGDDWEIVARLEQEYVPNGLIPGEWGDYIDLVILEDGKIENWRKKPSVEEFF